MCRSILVSSALAVALVAVAAGPASAQNPFAVEGIITDANNSGVAPGALKTVDPSGSTKELGPLNGNATKIGVINTAPLPMLGLTNPNGQVDLNTIYTQTAVAANDDIWFYFAWARDANTGSGFLSIELQQSPVGRRDAITPRLSTNSADRQLQSVGESPGGRLHPSVGPAGQRPHDLQARLHRSRRLRSAAHPGAGRGSGQRTGGIQRRQFPRRGGGQPRRPTCLHPEACQSFANTIPGTVTGNSDTADYKDTVLSAFPPISNCGSITVTKVDPRSDGCAVHRHGHLPVHDRPGGWLGPAQRSERRRHHHGDHPYPDARRGFQNAR